MIFHLKHWGDLEAVTLLHITYEQASRKPVFPSIRQFTVCNQEVKGEHFCSQSNEKPLEKKSLLIFLWRTTLLFAVLFVGKSVPFSLCKFQPWKSCCVLLGVVWCPGFAEAPMPGSLSRGTGQGEGGLHREVVPKEKVLRQSWLQSGLGVKRR